MTNYLIEDDESGLGKCLVLKTNWSSSYESVINNKNISILRLSFSIGWKDAELGFIENLHKLRGLEVYSWKVNDLTPLYKLPDLNYLGIQADIKKKFELKRFPELKVLKIVLNAKVKDLPECVNLEHINIVNYPYESFVKISNLIKLKRVQITSRKLTSTEGISNFPEVEELDFYDCKKLNSLAEINRIEKIKRIHFSNCNGISGIDVLGGAKNLESIIIENCGELKSIDCLQKCRNLKRLLLIGNTSIKDGDLSVIRTLPKLKDIRVGEHKHYNMSKEQIMKVVNNK